MGGNIKILISFASALLIIFTGFFIFYNTPAKTVASIDKNTKSYFVNWIERESLCMICSDLTEKNSNYKKTIIFETPNLKELTFSLKWIDDKTSFLGLFGRDTLKLEIITPDGQKFTESAKSALITKRGQVEINIPVNNIKPTELTLKSESIFEAGEQLEANYFDYKWVNEEFIVKVTVQTGEIRFLKRLSDKGNDFDLKIISSYFYASINNNELTNESNIDNDSSIKESDYGLFPDCPICDDPLGHKTWCLFYDDPFDCNWCGERYRHKSWCPYYDDPWDEDPWNDDDDDWNSNKGYPLTEPWQVVFLFAFYIFSFFFNFLLIF